MSEQNQVKKGVSPGDGAECTSVIDDGSASAFLRRLEPIFENLILHQRSTFDLEAAAQYLCCPPSTVKRYAKKKQIGFHLVGHQMVFTKQDLDDFLKQKRTESIWG